MAVQPPTDAFQLPPTEKLQTVIAILNRYLKTLRERLDKLEGAGGRTPTFHQDLDMQKHRITNVKRSQYRSDVLTRGEFDDFQQEISMLEEQVRLLTKRLDSAGVA